MPSSDGRAWQHEWVRAGYLDARAGRGFADFYAAANRDCQCAYELGRCWAVNMLAAGIEPPDWRNGPPPPPVTEANEKAAAKGEAYALPWGRWPDTDDPVSLEPLFIPRRNRRRRRRN